MLYCRVNKFTQTEIKAILHARSNFFEQTTIQRSQQQSVESCCIIYVNVKTLQLSSQSCENQKITLLLRLPSQYFVAKQDAERCVTCCLVPLWLL